MTIDRLEPRFVEFIPAALEDGVLYISREHAVACHRCACGCSERVVTPLGPADWKVEVEHDAVTIVPSIGNGQFRCRSHYRIERDRIVWYRPMTAQAGRAVHQGDVALRERTYGKRSRIMRLCDRLIARLRRWAGCK